MENSKTAGNGKPSFATFIRGIFGRTMLPGVLGFVAGFMPEGATCESSAWIPASDARFVFSGGMRRVETPAGGVHFDRVLEMANRHYRWNSPGTRLGWRTDAPSMVLHLLYRDIPEDGGRNGRGLVRRVGDGEILAEVDRPSNARSEVLVKVPLLSDGRMTTYEWIFPYGDFVEVLGIEASAGALWEPAPAKRAVRYLAFGDSVTQGFTATDVSGTYVFLLAETMGWDVINLGMAGRGTVAADAATIVEAAPEVVSVLIGVNDWQGGRDLEEYRASLGGLLKGIVEGLPEATVFVLTPLWVPETWRPEQVRYPLESYRGVVREVVASFGESQLRLIEGPSLIDTDASFFDAVAVHPNNLGFAQMAARLAPHFKVIQRASQP